MSTVAQLKAESRRYRLLGLLALVLAVAVLGSIVASYQQRFTPVTRAEVRSDQSGLLLEPGADVTLRGVTIGQVRSVDRASDGGARLGIAILAGKTHLVPRGSTARIIAPTVFGAKFVDLVPPAGGRSEGALRAHDVIRAQVGTEVNDVFANLQRALLAIDAGKLNAVLGSLAQGLDGKGTELGDLFAASDTYLKGLNPSLPALQTDLQRGTSVADAVTSVTPQLVALLANVSVFTGTVQDTQARFVQTLRAVTGVTTNVASVLTQDEAALRRVLDQVRPVARVLNTYAGVIPCTLRATVSMGDLVKPVLGGVLPGFNLLPSFLPGQKGYTTPGDLPKIASVPAGPDCLGESLSSADIPNGPGRPSYIFDDGAHPFPTHSDAVSGGSVSILQTLGALPLPGAQR